MEKTSCRFCGVLCTTLTSLCNHVLGKKHTKVISRVSPSTVEDLGQVQYFVDTYLESIPVLGVEYMVQTQARASYPYNCRLCNMELNWQQMVFHITSEPHMRAYIARHHDDLPGSSTGFIHLSKKELYTLAKSIKAKYGSEQAHIKESNADAPEPPTKADPTQKEHDKTNSVYSGPLQDSAIGLATVALQEGSKISSASGDCVHRCSHCGVSSSSFPALNEHVMSAQHRRHLQESLKDCEPKSQILHCSLCNISCLSFVKLCGHVMSKNHMVKMQQSSTPSEQCEVGRLGHFLDTYMQEEPILGLEYIVEMGTPNTLYKYSCTLCKTNGNLQHIVGHLLNMGHLYRYIMAHHRHALQFDPNDPQKSLSINLLKNLAKDILDREWLKENSAPVAGDGKRRVDSVGERGDAPPTRSDGSNGIQREDLTGERDDVLPCRYDVGDGKRREDSPSTGSDASPSRRDRGDCEQKEDLAGNGADVPPSRGDSGSSFHSKKRPLPYPEEGCNSDKITLTPVIDDPHLVGERGDSPLSRHDRGDGKQREDLAGERSEAPPSRDDQGYDEKRKDFAKKGDNMPPSRRDGGSSFHSKKRPLPYPEEGYNSCSYKTTLTTPVIGNPSLTKRGRLEALPFTPHTSIDRRYDERRPMEQVASAVQDLQFHNNHKFFEYLANFKIKDNQDVILIREIIQNCMRALKRFQEEEKVQTPTLEPEAPLTATSRVDQKILVASVKPESPPLAPETILPKETPNPPAEVIPKNKLAGFFSRIKNMHESEVVGIFQKIAATNPEFQEMNIPAVIRHLKHTGRLNTP